MNVHLLLFRALAIIAVVLRHKYWPGPDYTFISSTIPLFLFSSGYFYRPEDEKNPPAFFGRKFRHLIVPYYLYNAFYALITVLIFYTTGSRLGSRPTWYNFWLRPWVDGQQYQLISPMWFVMFLFVTLLVYLVVSWLLRRLRLDATEIGVAFILIGLGAYALRHELPPGASNCGLWGYRVAVGTAYLALGQSAARHLPHADWFRFRYLLPVLALRLVFQLQTTTTIYSYFNAEFTHPASIVFTLTEIYLLLYLARFLMRFPVAVRGLSAVGHYSYHIMANHMLVFLIIDWIIAAVAPVDPNRHAVLFYTWWLYAIAAVAIPTGISSGMTALKRQWRRQ
ncbi:MAG: acyltransferase family protein [Victivallales bacterium]|nr:acyltransferase family protein [Victivallales bacterium]